MKLVHSHSVILPLSVRAHLLEPEVSACLGYVALTFGPCLELEGAETRGSSDRIP
jgi:hypothetical protein